MTTVAGTAPSVEIAANVRMEMARQQLTTQLLSQRAGISYNTLRRAVRGERDFTVPELITVALVLDVPIGDLLPAPLAVA